MTRQPDKTKSILQAVEHSEQRSPLFWWMVEHHDELRAASADRRIPWKAFCERATAEGLTDTRGRPPTERNARETWRVARIFVAQAAARRAHAESTPSRSGSVFPSRVPPNWRPEEVQPHRTGPPIGASASVSAGAPASSDQLPLPARPLASTSVSPFADTRTKEEIDAHIREQDAKMDEMIARHDRRYKFGG